MTFTLRPRRARPLTESDVERLLYPWRRPVIPAKTAAAQLVTARRRTKSVHLGRH